MARKPRLHIPGGLYHVILRGNARQDVFFVDATRIMRTPHFPTPVPREIVSTPSILAGNLWAIINIVALPLN